MEIAGQYHFQVIIDNTVMSFAKISAIESSMEYEVLQEGGCNLSPHILPVPKKNLKTLKLERGIRKQSGEEYQINTGMNLENGICISVLDSFSNTVASYVVEGVNVVRHEVGSLDAISSNVLYETFEVTYTAVNREL